MLGSGAWCQGQQEEGGSGSSANGITYGTIQEMAQNELNRHKAIRQKGRSLFRITKLALISDTVLAFSQTPD